MLKTKNPKKQKHTAGDKLAKSVINKIPSGKMEEKKKENLL